eukprot:TRINITY_DN8380_c0_g1_i1.p2 TRINITY_DN8380_c0_g1~~TRINITY_DN8380_c0_g1_i1.p2  ORF type:complete len:116 (+),score=26.85 TRINITY_DN8380_c0_g1_i1:114-461(+)
MPTLLVQTNVPVDVTLTSDFLKDASKVVAKTIGKPEAYVMVSIKGEVPIVFGGTEEPAAFAQVYSIGGLGPDTNKKLSSGLSELLQSKFDIPPSRFFLNFNDIKGSNWGFNGSTF